MTVEEWAQLYNAERLVVGVEQALRGWDRDPTQAASNVDVLLRMASPRDVWFLEVVYRRRRRSLGLPLLESDPNPHIRWRALRARIRHPGNEAHLRRALLDRDARVRYLARVGMRALGHTVTADLYRATLAERAATSDAMIGALAGLADMGTRDDSPRIIRFLEHPNARLRGEAWRALAAVDPDEFDRRTDQLSADPSGKVRRHLPTRRQER